MEKVCLHIAHNVYTHLHPTADCMPVIANPIKPYHKILAQTGFVAQSAKTVSTNLGHYGVITGWIKVFGFLKGKNGCLTIAKGKMAFCFTQVCLFSTKTCQYLHKASVHTNLILTS